jgi:hypothetical protein
MSSDFNFSTVKCNKLPTSQAKPEGTSQNSTKLISNLPTISAKRKKLEFHFSSSLYANTVVVLEEDSHEGT